MTRALLGDALSVLIAAGLGSIPFGLWWGRWIRGVDVRKEGSRNLGATNVYRVLGPVDGGAVLLLDVGKGILAVFVARWLTRSDPFALAAGMAAILGHTFSPWVGFRGGKGVAVGLGVWLVIAPVATLLALLAWGIALAASRRVSVASLLAATILPFAVAGFGNASGRPLRVVLAALLAILVWARHRGNLVRLYRGEEPPLWGARRS